MRILNKWRPELLKRVQIIGGGTPGRKFNPPVCSGTEKLVVLGHRGRRQRECESILAATDVQGQRNALVSLSASLSRGTATRTDRGRLRGAVSLEHRIAARLRQVANVHPTVTSERAAQGARLIDRLLFLERK